MMSSSTLPPYTAPPGYPDKDYFETNMLGAENVTAYASAQGITTILFTSSIAPYGASEELKTEESLPMPNTPMAYQNWWLKNTQNMASRRQQPPADNITPRSCVRDCRKWEFHPDSIGLCADTNSCFPEDDTIKACIYVKDLVRLMLHLTEQSQPGVTLYNLYLLPATHTGDSGQYAASHRTETYHTQDSSRTDARCRCHHRAIRREKGPGICPARVKS